MRLFSESDDAQIRLWVERAQKGDRRAWDSLVDRFQNLVLSTALRTGIDRNDAGDVFQTTFLALYKNLDRIDKPETLPKWLAVTASREALRVKRSSSRYVQESEEMPLSEILADEDASAESQATDAVEADYWRKAVVKLGGRCQELLTALYFEDKSYEDVLAEIGIPIGAIGPTRARCLEKLKKMYQMEHPEARD